VCPRVANQTPAVLVIDDHQGWRKKLIRLLSENRYHVISASSFDRALRILSRGGIGLVVLDSVMDGRDTGFQVCSQCRSIGIPVIVVSDLANASYVAAIQRDYGLAGYHDKRNFRPGEFLMDVFRNSEPVSSGGTSKHNLDALWWLYSFYRDLESMETPEELTRLVSNLREQQRESASQAIADALEGHDRRTVSKAFGWLLNHSWELAVQIAPTVLARLLQNQH
jgi:CheY-like chemotaxis protein